MDQPASNYAFRFEGGSENVYVFTTSGNIAYRIWFKPTPYFFNTAWVFHDDVVELTIDVADNPTKQRPPLDRVLPGTVAAIVRDFYQRRGHTITLYICDASDRRHSARQRKFDRWFSEFAAGQLLKVNWAIQDKRDGLTYFIALFTTVSNPQLPAIMAEFQRIAEGYNDVK